MAHKLADRVLETSTTGGTGALTLAGAVPFHTTFAAMVGVGNTTLATVWEVDANGNATGAYEGGVYTLSGATTLGRPSTPAFSSNGGALVNFTTGTTKYVAVGLLAAYVLSLDPSNNLWLPDSLGDPSSPSSGIALFVRNRAGRRLLVYEAPSGVDNAFQPQLWGNRVSIWSPGSGTALGSFGGTPTTAATLSHPTPATTTLAESLHRTRFATSTTAGNASGARDALNTVWRGDAAGRGGFFYHCRFASGSISLSGGQKIIGMSSSTAALSVEPSALTDVLGMLKDTTDTNWQFARRTGTGTVQKVNLGVAVANNQTFDLLMYAPPNGSGVGVRIVQYTAFNAYTVLLDTTYTDNLPAAGTLIGRHFQVRNGSTAAADNLELVRCYLESDF